MLVEVRVPKLGAGWGFHYEKFHRVAQAWAIVGVAALVRRSNGAIAEARIGLTNMGPTPLRAAAARGRWPAPTPAGTALARGGRARRRGHAARRRPARRSPTTAGTWPGC